MILKDFGLLNCDLFVAILRDVKEHHYLAPYKDEITMEILENAVLIPNNEDLYDVKKFVTSILDYFIVITFDIFTVDEQPRIAYVNVKVLC